MNREEAKYLLRAYGVGGKDAHDPQFREALDLLKVDPELARWFAEEQAVDLRLARVFSAFPVPPDLKAQLLAARKIISPVPWWKKPAWLSAAAACLVFAVTIAVVFVRQPSSGQFSDFRYYAADIAAGKFGGLELISQDLPTVRRWLHDRNAPDDFVVPAGLKGRPSLGCRVLDWNGRTISFVCFRLENGPVVHLLVVDRAAFLNIPNGFTREIAASNGRANAIAWSDDRHVYVLASTRQSEEELKRLL